jgi:hypothetical protein
MVCLGNICINTLHKGDNDDDDDDNDNNNNINNLWHNPPVDTWPKTACVLGAQQHLA